VDNPKRFMGNMLRFIHRVDTLATLPLVNGGGTLKANNPMAGRKRIIMIDEVMAYHLERFEIYRTTVVKNRPRTVTTQMTILKALAHDAHKFHAGAKLWELETFDLEMLLGRRNLSAGSFMQYRQALVALAEYCVKAKLIANAEQANGIAKPTLGGPNPNPVTELELERLLTVAAVSDPRMHAMITLAAYAGMRCAEIANAHSRDFDWDTHPQRPTVRIEGKGGKVRTVPMHPLVSRNCALYGMPDDGYLFPSAKRKGQPLCAHAVSDLMREFMAACGIDKSAHKLRHRFGTLAYNRTRDIELVSTLLGHSSTDITKAYVATSTNDEAAHRAVAML
jgi:integrase